MPTTAVLEKRARAVELASSGLTYDQVAVELGYANRSGAWKAVRAALSAREAEDVAQYRQLNLERLDALLAAVWERALGGDVRAIGQARAIVDAQCRLLSLI